MKSKSQSIFRHVILLTMCLASVSSIFAEDSMVRSKKYNNYYSIKYFDSSRIHYKTEIYTTENKLSSYYTFTYLGTHFELDSIFLLNDSGKITKQKFNSKNSFNDNDALQFTNGKEALYKLISENVEYPKYCIKKNLEGLVNVDFFVSREGLLICIYSHTKNINELFVKEAIRIIQCTEGKWIIDSEKYKHGVWGKIPITFELED